MLPHKWQCQKLHQFSGSVPGKIWTPTRTDLGVIKREFRNHCLWGKQYLQPLFSNRRRWQNFTGFSLSSAKMGSRFPSSTINVQSILFPFRRGFRWQTYFFTIKSWWRSLGEFSLSVKESSYFINLVLKGLRSWDLRLTSKDSVNKQEQKNEQASEIM